MAEVYWIHLPEHTDMFSEGYIGFTSKTATTRFIQHKSCAHKRYKNIPLLNAILKYKETLVVDVVCICDDTYGLSLERALRPLTNIGWNIAIGGEAPSRGRPTSDETKRKQSVSHKGKKQSKEEIEKRAASHRGTKRCEQARKNISSAMRGRKLSDAHKKKISEYQKGRKPTPEQVKKSAEARTAWRSGVVEVWLFAARAKELWDERKPRKFGESVLEVFPNYTKASFDRLMRKIKSGWNPLEDEEYLIWYESNIQSKNNREGLL